MSFIFYMGNKHTQGLQFRLNSLLCLYIMFAHFLPRCRTNNNSRAVIISRLLWLRPCKVIAPAEYCIWLTWSKRNVLFKGLSHVIHYSKYHSHIKLISCLAINKSPYIFYYVFITLQNLNVMLNTIFLLSVIVNTFRLILTAKKLGADGKKSMEAWLKGSLSCTAHENIVARVDNNQLFFLVFFLIYCFSYLFCFHYQMQDRQIAYN